MWWCHEVCSHANAHQAPFLSISNTGDDCCMTYCWHMSTMPDVPPCRRYAFRWSMRVQTTTSLSHSYPCGRMNVLAAGDTCQGRLLRPSGPHVLFARLSTLSGQSYRWIHGWRACVQVPMLPHLMLLPPILWFPSQLASCYAFDSWCGQ